MRLCFQSRFTTQQKKVRQPITAVAPFSFQSIHRFIVEAILITYRHIIPRCGKAASSLSILKDAVGAVLVDIQFPVTVRPFLEADAFAGGGNCINAGKAANKPSDLVIER